MTHYVHEPDYRPQTFLVPHFDMTMHDKGEIERFIKTHQDPKRPGDNHSLIDRMLSDGIDSLQVGIMYCKHYPSEEAITTLPHLKRWQVSLRQVLSMVRHQKAVDLV